MEHCINWVYKSAVEVRMKGKEKCLSLCDFLYLALIYKGLSDM